MKILYILMAFLFTNFVYAEDIVVKNDNGTPQTNYLSRPGWEEAVMLKPAGPCIVKKIMIYYAGTTAAKDTIYIVGDPSEGAVSPTQWVLHYNQIADPIYFDYDGTPGWYEFDVDNISSDGWDRIIVQHILNPNGPWFAVDDDGTIDPLSSWVLDPYTNNSLGFPGNYYRANGDYLVRLVVEYSYPLGQSSANPPAPVFTDITRKAGFVDGNDAAMQATIVSCYDFNNDGFDDFALGSRFFKNLYSDLTDISDDMSIPASGTIWADIDNDGNIDCFAARGNTNDRIYYGNGDGTFTEETDPTIILDQPTVSPMFLDYDGDGLLDLFIAYGRRTVNGNEVYYPDQLFRNTGNRKFENVTILSGISQAEPSPYYDCWGASICDYNNDNKPDIFVATYRLAPDLLYRNNGDGTFTEVGAATGARGMPTLAPQYFGHGMGSDWADINNDGYVDLAIGNLGHPDWRGAVSNPSLIFVNQGPPDYSFNYLITLQSGLKFFEMNAGMLWGDLDQDGNIDLYHCQYSYDKKGAGVDRFSRLYINSGEENNYKLIDKTWEYMEPIHGAWTPTRNDFDNDGDIDLFIGSGQENVKLYRNDIPDKGNWVSFKLQGDPINGINNNAYGSSIEVIAGGKSFYRQLPGSVLNARSGQSTDELFFGLGDAESISSIKVKYQNGMEYNYTNVAINSKYTIKYGQEPEQVLTAPQQIYPPNNSIQKEGKFSLKWRNVDGAENYTINVFNKNNDLVYSDYIDIIDPSINEVEIDFEINNQLYSWEAIADNQNSYEQKSSRWFFYLGTPLPSKPELIAPANQEKDLGSRISFDWTDVVYNFNYGINNSYELEIASMYEFSEVMYKFDGIIESEYFIEDILEPGQQYYWHVRAVNGDTYGQWSEVFDFATIGLPGTVILTLPENDELGTSAKPKFEWNAIENAKYYSFQLSKTDTFEELVFEYTTLSNNYVRILKKLDYETEYFWHVKAKNDAGSGNWSETWSFTTEKSTGVEDNIEQNIKCRIIPNPMDNLSVVNFISGIDIPITLRVFDLQGNAVLDLGEILLEKGTKSIDINLTNLSSGVYFLEYSTKESSVTKMIIKQ